MKRILLFAGLVLMMVLAACSSPEEDEVLEYHNNMVDTVNPKMEQLDALYTQVYSAQTDQDVIDLYKNDIIPLVEEIKDYFDSQNPETDVTKEYHDLRAGWINTTHEAVLIELEYFESLLDESVTEEAILELEGKLDEKNTEAIDLDTAATEKWDELKEEYDFIEEEE